MDQELTRFTLNLENCVSRMSRARAGKPVLHKVPLPSATATQFRSAAASHKIPDRQWRGAPAPVGFAPSRRGRGRRISRSQVKVQTRRITGPAPRPRRCKRLRVGDMRRTFSKPDQTPRSSTTKVPINRKRTRRGQRQNRCSSVHSAGHFRRSLPPSETMPKKGDNSNRSSKKSQQKAQRKYNVYSQRTVRIKEALREKQRIT